MKYKILILLFSLTLMFTYIHTCFAYECPEYIKIGLFYNKTAVNSVKVNFNNGVDAGFEDAEGYFTPLFYSNVIKNITFQKPSAYRLKALYKYDTYSEAYLRAEEIRTSDICASVAFDNGYYVYIGSYENAETAKAAVGRLTEIYGGGYETVAPSANAVELCADESSNPFFIFVQSNEWYLLCNPIGDDEGRISVNGTQYRGSLMIKRLSNSDMTVINKVKINHYLYSVIGGEISSSWHTEALKTQAIVSKSFALSNMNKFKKYGFNLDATTNSQVYFGTSKEDAKTREAVDAVDGKVVLYNGKPAETIFGAMSGGKTENSSLVWGGSEIPYLMGITDEYEDTDNLNHKYAIWQTELTAEQIKSKLASRSINIGDILDVQALEYTPSDRVYKLKITGTDGEHIFERESTRTAFGLNSQMYKVYKKGEAVSKDIYTAEDNVFKVLDLFGTRSVTVNNSKVLTGNGIADFSGAKAYVLTENGTQAIDTQTITSTTETFFEVDPNAPLTFVFDGRGWGHGVGLSQYGAKHMAEKGFTYDEIVKYYFPGTTISD